MAVATTIAFNLAEGKSLSDAQEAISRAEAAIRMPNTVRGSYQGTARAFQDSLRDQPLLILAAILTIYIVLGVLYESLVHPITILSTLPSAGVGALLALMMFGSEFSIIAFIKQCSTRCSSFSQYPPPIKRSAVRTIGRWHHFCRRPGPHD